MLTDKIPIFLFQTEELGDILGITFINSMSLDRALSGVSDPLWQDVLNSDDYTLFLRVPANITFDPVLEAGTEGNAFSVQPAVHFLDKRVSTCI